MSDGAEKEKGEKRKEKRERRKEIGERYEEHLQVLLFTP